MHKENIPTEIFDLLAAKSFDLLSETERSLVAPWLSEMEYKSFRSTILNLQTADQSWEIEVPDPPSKVDTLPRISRLLNYPIPAYQVAISFLLIFGCFFIFRSQQKPLDQSTNTGEIIAKGVSIDQDEYPEDLVFYP